MGSFRAVRKIDIRPEAAAAACLLFYLDPSGAFLPFLAAAALHEAAHIAALWLCGGRGMRLRLGGTGAVLSHAPLPPGRLVFCALAGPAANLICLAAFARCAPRLAAVSALLGAYNLLPVEPLDGGTALRAALCPHLSLVRCDRVMAAVRAVTLSVLGLLALWCALYLRGGIWPLLLLGALLVRLPGEKRVANRAASA